MFLTETPSLGLEPLRLLLMGESGNGKTGSLLALAEAGYTLHILDTDHKAASMFRQLSDNNQTTLSRLDVEPVAETMTIRAGKMKIKGKPKAFERSVSTLDRWRNENFNRSHIVVVDSFTSLSRYAGFVAAEIANRSDGFPIFQDFGAAFNLLRPTLELLTGYETTTQDDGTLVEPTTQFNCHVIVLAHINMYEVKKKTGEKVKVGKVMVDETVVTDTIGYPKALGQALSPEIPTYFNTVLRMDRSGERRRIRTVSSDLIPTKTPIRNLNNQLPIETALATYFTAAGFTAPGNH